ncbi:hypothetical protein Tco_0538093 [Tanacetum coccineum]
MRYTKQKIRVEYVWKPHCSTCLIFGHSRVDCPKAPPKRVVNSLENGKEQSSKADDEGFIEVKNKKSGGINEGNKTFKPVSVKPTTCYYPVAKQSTGGTSNSLKMTPFAGKKMFRHQGSEDEVKSVDNEMASYLALKTVPLVVYWDKE